jgi:hypothetical protein
VIEVHSPEGLQLFRNFNFYKYCGYSIEELYSDSWDKLYERDERVASLMFEFVNKIYGGLVRTTVAPEIPPYRARELFSSRRYEVEVKWEWGAPLFAEGTSQPKATIAIETAKLIHARISPSVKEPHLTSLA